jgi:serine/threonine-protein phosphatase 2A activator
MSRPLLKKLANRNLHDFAKPAKKIYDGTDVQHFLMSHAYRDIMTFVLQLNHAVVPRKATGGNGDVQKWTLDTVDVSISQSVRCLQELLRRLEQLIEDAPPDTGPRRFGNVSFRTWQKLVETNARQLLTDSLPSDLSPALDEIEAYLLGSFGSAARLDYGTGHELSFLAFLGCLWKLDYFETADPGVMERGIVLGVFEQYLALVRRLIKTYTLEPAGSHGVWGLDDNSFLPYVFGSAQLSPAINESDATPIEGSLPDAPEPNSVAKANLVEKEQSHNMYFAAVAFIFEVKKGPFWEHSPYLYDISGIKDGWGKINKGMLKMYNGEVLSKFPVVQHFPFGSLFRWDKDPAAKPPVMPADTYKSLRATGTDASATARPTSVPSTAAPWASATPRAPAGFVNGVTQAPWAARGPAPTSTGSMRAPFRRPEPAIPERAKSGEARKDST